MLSRIKKNYQKKTKLKKAVFWLSLLQIILTIVEMIVSKVVKQKRNDKM